MHEHGHVHVSLQRSSPWMLLGCCRSTLLNLLSVYGAYIPGFCLICVLILSTCQGNDGHSIALIHEQPFPSVSYLTSMQIVQ